MEPNEAMTKANKPVPTPRTAPAAGEPHLEDSIAHATDVVRRKFTEYRTHLIVAAVVIVGAVAVSTFLENASRSRIDGMNEQFYLAFTRPVKRGAPNEEIRTETTQLLQRWQGEACAPWMAAQFVAWLYEKNEPGYREDAWKLLDEVRARHPESPTLKNLSALYEASRQTFVVPPPEPKPAPPEPAPPSQPQMAPPATGTTPAPPPAGTTTPPAAQTDPPAPEPAKQDPPPSLAPAPAPGGATQSAAAGGN
jgi:hypothetical protein